MVSESNAPVVVPVVLSGGSGTRLWPLSRETSPKQFLPLLTGLSLFQQTVLRAQAATTRAPVVVCNVEHRFVVQHQLAQLEVEPAAIICEPVARNTAPAVAAAASLVGQSAPDALLLVLPSDHVVTDTADFARDVAAAVPAAGAGHLVTFGITPTTPHTGFGYIRQGPPIAGMLRACAAERFVEKPHLAQARGYVEDGKWMWNSGMFLLPREVLLEELLSHEPRVAHTTAIAVALARREGSAVFLDEKSFACAPTVSLDYAVMEPTTRAAVLPTTLGWSDVGAWSSLWEVRDKDGDGNVLHGDVLAEDSHDCYVHSDGPLVTALGMSDVTVVATKDAVLVADRAHSQQVREVVARLRTLGRAEADCSALVRRPWGTYESLGRGVRHQVKHIEVLPGQKLSLQRHAHRAEHWVVVQGTAQVVRGGDTLVLQEGESLHVPVGCVHRLENRCEDPLHLIEVQVGDYLGEDDIERLDDKYGRS